MSFKAKTSKGLPIGLIVVSILFLAVNYIAELFSDYYFPKLLIGGIATFTLGVVMLIFPPADAHNPNQVNELKHLLKHSNKVHVLIWILALLGGVGLGFWYVISNNYPL